MTQILAGRGLSVASVAWREVADLALAFIRRFVEPRPVAERESAGAGAG